MGYVQLALSIVNLINAATPGAANLILMIRNADGTISVPVILDQADAQFDANLKQALDAIKNLQGGK